MNEKKSKLDQVGSKFLTHIQINLDKNIHSNDYIASFSLNGDLLSQWRAYADFGRGYSIGFKFDGFCPHPQIASLKNVIYERDVLIDLFNELFNFYRLAIDKYHKNHIEDMAQMFVELITSASYYFKDPSFSEEQEVRIRCLANDTKKVWKPDVNFRTINGFIVPYIATHGYFEDKEESKIIQLPIKSIILGPSVATDENFNSVRMLLIANGYEDVELIKSTIPLRY